MIAQQELVYSQGSRHDTSPPPDLNGLGVRVAFLCASDPRRAQMMEEDGVVKSQRRVMKAARGDGSWPGSASAQVALGPSSQWD